MAVEAPVCRLLIEHAPNSGAWNMAVDELLLESALTKGTGCVRIYRWSAATLSLGYFQTSIPEDMDLRFRDLPRVRRLSGGGAILHHHELTYSCVVPPSHASTADPVDLYDRIHLRIMECLTGFGFASALRGKVEHPRDDEFLCFGRANPHDVVLAGMKVLGSAQRRRRGAVLQHGSLVLQRSEYVPEFPGLFDLAGHAACPDGLSAVLAPAIAGAVFESTLGDQLTDEEQIDAAQRVQERDLSGFVRRPGL